MKPQNPQQWVGMLLSNAGVIIVAWFAFGQAQVTVEPDYVQVLQDENTSLRAEQREADARRISLEIKLADIQRLVGDGVAHVEAQAIWSVLDRLTGRPAWCKEVVYIDQDGDGVAEHPTFVMRKINTAYAARYDFSPAFYEGKTDFQAQPAEVAQAYYDNDYQAWLNRSYYEFTEPVLNFQVPGLFAKWWTDVPSSTEYVCGLEVGEMRPLQ